MILLSIALLNQQANTLAEAGLPERAEAIYLDALKQNPVDYEGHILLYNLGTLYLTEEKWDESLLAFLPLYPLTIPPFLQVPFNRNLALALAARGKVFYPLAQEIDPSVEIKEKTEDKILDTPFHKLLSEAIALEEQALIGAIRGEKSDLQSQVLALAEKFPQSIYETQEKEKECLSQNWEKVLSLVNEGTAYAKRGTPSDQIRSIGKWKSIFSLNLDPIPQEEVAAKTQEKKIKQELFNMSLSDERIREENAPTEVDRPW